MTPFDTRERYRDTGLESYIDQELLIEYKIFSARVAPGCAPDDPWETHEHAVKHEVNLEAVEKEGIRASGRYYYFRRTHGVSDNESPVGHKGGWENLEQIVQIDHSGIAVYKYGNGRSVGFGGTLRYGDRVDD